MLASVLHRSFIILPILSLTLLAAAFAGCKQKPDVPELVKLRYFQHADRLCRLVVECIKADTAERLAAEPERRDMVLGRMTRDLCREERSRLIGVPSTTPDLTNQQAPFGPEEARLYDIYGRCADAVTAQAGNCDAVQRAYEQDGNCNEVRAYTPPI